MKINKVDKIDEHFREIKTESIFSALKEKKYTGFTRSEINRMLEKYSIDRVFANLKTRYRKRNYLLIYFISLISLLALLGGLVLFIYINDEMLVFTKYIDFNQYKDFYFSDYCMLLLLSASLIMLFFLLYEIILKSLNNLN